MAGIQPEVLEVASDTDAWPTFLAVANAVL